MIRKITLNNIEKTYLEKVLFYFHYTNLYRKLLQIQYFRFLQNNKRRASFGIMY